jgi:cation:H+ antiporter
LREYPVVLGVSVLAFVLLWNQSLDRIDGIILVVCLVLITFWMIRIGRQGSVSDPLEKDLNAEIPTDMSTRRALGLLGIGLILLLLSSRILVWGASEIATAFGVSDLIIGLTIVAIGTSLPELAASITGALKGESDLAIGNVLGSNLYNLLAVLSLPGLIAPGPISSDVLQRDLPLMLILTIAIFLMSHRLFSPRCRINRFEGGVLLLTFAAYQFWLYHSAASVTL